MHTVAMDTIQKLQVNFGIVNLSLQVKQLGCCNWNYTSCNAMFLEWMSAFLCILRGEEKAEVEGCFMLVDRLQNKLSVDIKTIAVCFSF